MGGNHPPRALHHELHRHGAAHEEREGGREGPERHQGETPDEGRNHGAPPADVVRPEPEHDAADDGADHRQRRQRGAPGRRESPVALEEGRVHVLRPVRHRVERRHEEREVAEEPPVGGDRPGELGPAPVPRPLPDLRLAHVGAHVEGEERRETADEEHRAPAEAGKDQEVAERGEQVARRVAFLEEPREDAPQPGGRLLHGERRTDAPLAAHPDAEQGAQHEEAPVAGGEAGEHLDDRVEDEVDHEREAAPVAVGEEAEEEGADRAEGERQGDRERDGGVRGVELLRDRGEGEDDEEEVERVERPAEE